MLGPYSSPLLPIYRLKKVLSVIYFVGLERYQAGHPIPNTLVSNDTNTQYQYQYRKWCHLLDRLVADYHSN